MAGSSLTINDRKWRELKRQIPKVAGAVVTVGIQSDAGAGQNGTPIAAYAAYNEFGTQGRTPRRGGWGGPIPARPFLGSSFDNNRTKWSRAADTAISKALTGEMDFAEGLAILGSMAEDDIKATIEAGDFAPNSELTIALKGSDRPLINKAGMRQAIRYEVKL
jgi:hypothetical protein